MNSDNVVDKFADTDPDLAEMDTPEEFVVKDDASANWLIRKIVEAKNYSTRCAEWCSREQTRAARTEEFLFWKYGPQLMRWAEVKIAEQGDRRQSVNLPAGSVGFRTEPPRIVIDDEGAVLAWCKEHKPDLVQTVERLIKSGLNAHIKETGELPDQGVRIEPEREKFFVK